MLIVPIVDTVGLNHIVWRIGAMKAHIKLTIAAVTLLENYATATIRAKSTSNTVIKCQSVQALAFLVCATIELTPALYGRTYECI